MARGIIHGDETSEIRESSVVQLRMHRILRSFWRSSNPALPPGKSKYQKKKSTKGTSMPSLR
jgi:hypothetical protein